MCEVGAAHDQDDVRDEITTIMVGTQRWNVVDLDICALIFQRSKQIFLWRLKAMDKDNKSVEEPLIKSSATEATYIPADDRIYTEDESEGQSSSSSSPSCLESVGACVELVICCPFECLSKILVCPLAFGQVLCCAERERPVYFRVSE